MTPVPIPLAHNRSRAIRVIVAASVAVVVTVGVLVAPAQFPLLAALGVIAIAAAAAGLVNPQIAVAYLMVAMFGRIALGAVAPVDPFVPAFAGVLLAMLLWLSARHGALPRPTWLDPMMVGYLLWNIYSWCAPHDLTVNYPLTDTDLSVYRFILTGTAIPFTMYLVGRMVYRSERSVRVVIWMTGAFGAYSALMNICQFHAPALVFPRYIVTAPNWAGRANGIFNQPVANGICLIAGFLAVITLATDPRLRSVWIRVLLYVAAGAMAYGAYLTYTRVVWLAFVIVIIVGAVLAKPRTPYVISLLVVIVGVMATWSRLTSSDRSAGGVASVNEVDDRLNSLATSWWAIQEKPLFGWGIGRFTALNTVHHQRFSEDIPWMRGFGISSHQNEAGIFVELGIIGVGLWLAVLVLLALALVRAVRALPDAGVCGRNLALLAALTMLTLVIAGTTVDLRFFDFPNALAFLLAGIAIGWYERSRGPGVGGAQVGTAQVGAAQVGTAAVGSGAIDPSAIGAPGKVSHAEKVSHVAVH